MMSYTLNNEKETMKELRLEEMDKVSGGDKTFEEFADALIQAYDKALRIATELKAAGHPYEYTAQRVKEFFESCELYYTDEEIGEMLRNIYLGVSGGW